MFRVDYRDAMAGALLLTGGVAMAIYAKQHYTIGVLRDMGPGAFPMGVGAAIACFGAVILAQAWRRSRPIPQAHFGTALVILASVAAFALLVRPMGLVPAIIACVFVSSLAESRFNLLKTAMLCVTIALIGWLVFGVALGLPVDMFRSPF